MSAKVSASIVRGDRPRVREINCAGSTCSPFCCSSRTASNGLSGSSMLYDSSPASASYQTLPVMPCTDGWAPVASVACPTMVSVLAWA